MKRCRTQDQAQNERLTLKLIAEGNWKPRLQPKWLTQTSAPWDTRPRD